MNVIFQEQIFPFKHMRDICTTLFLVLDLMSSSDSVPYDVISYGSPSSSPPEESSQYHMWHHLRRPVVLMRSPISLSQYQQMQAMGAQLSTHLNQLMIILSEDLAE